MNSIKSLLLALAVIVASAVLSAAQVTIEVTPAGQPSADEIDDALINEVFTPITDQLNLSATQKLRIASIIRNAITVSDPLFDRLDRLDYQLFKAAMANPADEKRIGELTREEAQLLGQTVTLKSRAKVAVYRVLSPDQRALVAAMLQAKAFGNAGVTNNDEQY
jgi:hypothetical protein